jgi:hypothetical protein
MALPLTQQQREYTNFKDNGDQTTSRFVHVVNSSGTPSGSILSGINWDYFSFSSPNSLTDVWTYKLGGPTGAVVATVTVIYDSECRSKILSVQRS